MSLRSNVFTSYLRDSYEEFQRVTWPTKNQAVRLSAIVLSFVLLSAVFIGAIDYVFHFGYAELLKLR